MPSPTVFPPQPLPTGSSYGLLGQTGSFGTVPVFTAPATGYYQLDFVVTVVSTDGAGTLTVTVTAPHTQAAAASPTLSAPVADGSTACRIVFMAAGESMTMSGAAVGVTGTVYNVLASIIQTL